MWSTAAGRLKIVVVVCHDRNQPAQTWPKNMHFGVDKILDKKKNRSLKTHRILALTYLKQIFDGNHGSRAFGKRYCGLPRPETTCTNVTKNSVFWHFGVDKTLDKNKKTIINHTPYFGLDLFTANIWWEVRQLGVWLELLWFSTTGTNLHKRDQKQCILALTKYSIKKKTAR